MPQTRRQIVFFILGGFFLTNAIVAELTGGKLFELPWFRVFGNPVVLSIGVIPWPIVFLTTDLINEYFGKAGVRKLTFLAVGMIIFAFLVLFAAIRVPTWTHSPVSGNAFEEVFGPSQWIIVGSLAAFVIAQLVDVLIFSRFKTMTGNRLLWLRATGSTVVSQIVDTFVVHYVGLVLPGKLTFDQMLHVGTGNYLFKLTVAILITPLIYLGHRIIDRYLEHENTIDAATPNSSAPFLDR